jgi:hypothetical protein
MRPRFSLQVVFVITTLICVVVALIARERQRCLRQKQLVQELNVIGVYLSTSETESVRPDWLKAIVGDDAPGRCSYADASNTRVGDSEQSVANLCEKLEEFKNLRAITISYTALNDDGLGRLCCLQSIRSLDISATKVTDAGLKQVVRMEQLESIKIDYTAVTDRGFAGLKGLRRLRELGSKGTYVTADGESSLRAALPHVQITR